jgi:hypothetical protein
MCGGAGGEIKHHLKNESFWNGHWNIDFRFRIPSFIVSKHISKTMYQNKNKLLTFDTNSA